MASVQNDNTGGRPAIFPSAWAEFSFCFSIVLSQVMSEFFFSGAFITIPSIIRDLGIPEASSIWPASAFSLTVGTALLIFGRLADMYGPQKVYICGMAWYTAWTLICGFSVNELMIDIGRAFQGFGPAAFLTSGLALLGAVYEPGRRKNIIFAIYSGTAPIGFFIGIVVGGTTSESLTWRWYFWIGTIINALGLVSGLLSISWNLKLQNDEEGAKKPKMDYWGAILFFVGLFLFTFSLTDSAHAPNGWLTPYIPALFILGCLILIVCIYYESKIAKDPLLPLYVLKLPYMGWFMFSQFLMFGAFGIWFFYISTYMQTVLDVGPLLSVAWFVPFGVTGIIISIISGIFLDRIPGILLLVLSSAAWVVANLLIAVAPVNASFWPWVFPSMVCGSLGIDVMYIVASVFLTSSLSKAEQGLAGSLFNSLQFLGLSTFLAFADITASEYADRGQRGSYQTALYLGTGCAAAALVLIVLFVRIGRASKSENEIDGSGTDIEKTARKSTEKLQEGEINR